MVEEFTNIMNHALDELAALKTVIINLLTLPIHHMQSLLQLCHQQSHHRVLFFTHVNIAAMMSSSKEP